MMMMMMMIDSYIERGVFFVKFLAAPQGNLKRLDCLI